MHINTVRNSQVVGEAISEQDWYQESGIHGRDVMVLIRLWVKEIASWVRSQDNPGLIVEVDSVEEKGSYCMRHLEGGTDIISPD